MSKREYAAQQAGGTLNYKTGKISVPAKKTSTPSKTSDSRGTPDAYGVYPDGSYDIDGKTYQTKYIQPDGSYSTKPAYTIDTKNLSGSSKKSGSSSKVNTTQRTNAQNALNGMSFLEASKLANQKISQGPSVSRTNNQSLLNDLWNDYSLIPGASAKITDLGDVLNKSAILDQPTGHGPNGEMYYNNYNPLTDGGSVFQSDFGKGFSRPGSETAWLTTGASPITYGATQRQTQESFGSSPVPISPNIPSQTSSNRTPSPVSRPTAVPDLFNPPAGISYSPQAQPEYTPTQTQPEPTIRQLLGNGYYSGGVMGNGAGLTDNFDFQGAMGINPAEDESNILNELFGIPTASAQVAADTETYPGLSFSSGNPQQARDILNQANTKLSAMSQMAPTNQTNQPNQYNQPNETMYTNQGGVAQPTTNPYAQQEEAAQKSYKKQQKALEKALKEMLRGIESEYAQSETEGTGAIEKAKGQTLGRTNAMFAFGLNQDPNSSQRVQATERVGADYAGQLSDFLSKLASSRTRDISSAKSGIQQQKLGLEQNLANLLNDIQSKKIAYAQQAANARSGSASNKILSYIQSLQKNWVANQDDPYGRPGGREAIANQAAATYGGSPQDYMGYMPAGWEGTAWTKPKTNSGQPQLFQDENGDWYYEPQ